MGVLALAAAWLALRPEPAPAATPPVDRPLWSADRFPALLAEAQGTVELERAVDALLGGLRSCFVVHEGDRPVLSRRPTLALTPASTQKILVAAAVVHRLGADFRFVTQVVAEERPRDGVVGPVWIVGSGDPFLATPEYVAHLAERPRSQDRAATP
ncbi:MAG TPA: D-alanyl-D-alanine carboxypeptidase, partial [Acidimicrobiia bacterium]|nr:D-alanyl-D-alanine carboxypeptidase [Acidimicrobiia bacterium]